MQHCIAYFADDAESRYGLNITQKKVDVKALRGLHINKEDAVV